MQLSEKSSVRDRKGSEEAERIGEQAQRIDIRNILCSNVDFMVKLLRACVWMPWRKQAMKDVVSCDKPREDANSL